MRVHDHQMALITSDRVPFNRDIEACVIEAVVHDELSGELVVVESSGHALAVDRVWHRERVAQYRDAQRPCETFEAVLQKRLGGFGMKLDKDAVVSAVGGHRLAWHQQSLALMMSTA